MEDLQNVDKISISKVEPKPQQVRTSYDILLGRVKRQKRFTQIGRILFLIGIFSGGIGMIMISPENRISSAIAAGSALSCILLGLGLLEKGSKRIFDKRKRIFYAFYHAYECMRTYTGIESDNKQKERKNTVYAFNGLSRVIKSWVDERSPDCFATLPRSISEKINQGLLPLIQQNKSDEITKLKIFRDFMYDFTLKVYDNDPSMDDLRQLDKQLEVFSKLPEAEITKEKFFKKYPLIKSITIGGICSFGLYLTLTFSELQWGASLLGSVTVGVAIITFVEMYRHRKKSN